MNCSSINKITWDKICKYSFKNCYPSYNGNREADDEVNEACYRAFIACTQKYNTKNKNN